MSKSSVFGAFSYSKCVWNKYGNMEAAVQDEIDSSEQSLGFFRDSLGSSLLEVILQELFQGFLSFCLFEWMCFHLLSVSRRFLSFPSAILGLFFVGVSFSSIWYLVCSICVGPTSNLTSFLRFSDFSASPFVLEF